MPRRRRWLPPLTPGPDFALVVGMFTEEERSLLAQVTTTMQVIVAAMVAGLIVFLGIAVVIASRMPGPAESRLVTFVSVAFAGSAVVAAMIVPGLFRRGQRQTALAKSLSQSTSASAPVPGGGLAAVKALATGYQTALVLRSALLEGGALFCLAAYLVERQAVSLVAAGVLILFLLGGFPTQSRLEEAIARERLAIAHLRQLE